MHACVYLHLHWIAPTRSDGPSFLANGWSLKSSGYRLHFPSPTQANPWCNMHLVIVRTQSLGCIALMRSLPPKMNAISPMCTPSDVSDNQGFVLTPINDPSTLCHLSLQSIHDCCLPVQSMIRLIVSQPSSTAVLSRAVCSIRHQHLVNLDV